MVWQLYLLLIVMLFPVWGQLLERYSGYEWKLPAGCKRVVRVMTRASVEAWAYFIGAADCIGLVTLFLCQPAINTAYTFLIIVRLALPYIVVVLIAALCGTAHAIRWGWKNSGDEDTHYSDKFFWVVIRYVRIYAIGAFFMWGVLVLAPELASAIWGG